MQSDPVNHLGPGGRRGRRPSGTLQIALTALLVFGGVACSATSPERDSGDGKRSSSVDSGLDVSAETCRDIRTAEACRERGCTWLSATCDTGRVVGRCFGPSAGYQVDFSCGQDAVTVDAGGSDTAPSDCDAGDDCEPPSLPGNGDGQSGDAGSSDARAASDGAGDVGAPSGDADAGGTTYCDRYRTSSTCKSDARCRWWTGTCSGQVVREECLGANEPAPQVQCNPIPREDCHEAASESACSPPNCTWVEKGCGGGSGNTVQIEACLPSGSCSSDADCPTDHSCVSVWLDPCASSACTACGRSAQRCVPNSELSP